MSNTSIVPATKTTKTTKTNEENKTMTKLDITFDANKSDRFPVYVHYPQQCQPQPAYITLDLETGECTADYSAEIGGTSSRQWHGIELTFKIDPMAHKDTIAEAIEDNAELFQRILDGATVEWDGNNYRGVLNKDADSAYESFGRYEDFIAIDRGVLILKELLEEDSFPAIGQSLSEFATDFMLLDGYCDMWFEHEPDYEDFESEILEFWLDCFYDRHDIPPHVAQLLLENNCIAECEEKHWIEELKEIADTSD